MEKQENHLDIFTPILKNIRGVEKTFGEYLFTIYVLPKINLDGICREERDKKIKEEREKFNKEFFRNKPQTISQREQILQDIEDIENADNIYKRHPQYLDKITKTVYGYPNRYRCNYIILSKHKYHRCKSKVAVDKEEKERLNKNSLSISDYNNEIYGDYCSHHINSDNEHLKPYIKLLEDCRKEKADADAEDTDDDYILV
jgi:hypothetical protein